MLTALKIILCLIINFYHYEERSTKPSALMTKIEVLKFRLKNSYQIPAAHHLNMVLFKGCSKPISSVI